MQGLSDEQIKELKLEDKWAKSCYPQGGSVEYKDPVGRRSGNAPNAKMKDVIDKTRNDAKAQVSKVQRCSSCFFNCELSSHNYLKNDGWIRIFLWNLLAVSIDLKYTFPCLSRHVLRWNKQWLQIFWKSFEIFDFKDLVQASKCLTYDDVQDALDKMKGAVMIVYPMGLPPHDPLKLELDNEEDLTGTQVCISPTFGFVIW